MPTPAGPMRVDKSETVSMVWREVKFGQGVSVIVLEGPSNIWFHFPCCSQYQ